MQSNAHFPAQFRHKIPPPPPPYIELDAVCQNDWRETTGKMCIKFAQQHLPKMDKAKINEQKKSIATGPLYVHTEFDMI